jgi:hypothetical protein
MNFLKKSKEYNPSTRLFAFQIFLLVLIVIGILLIATRNAWVPSVVGYLLRYDQAFQDTIVRQGELLQNSVKTEDSFDPLIQKTTNESINSFATEAETNVSSETVQNDVQVNEHEPYLIRNNALYYWLGTDKYELVATAINNFDQKTFTLINSYDNYGIERYSGYAKDKNNVYAGSSILKEADPGTFEVGEGFVKDSSHVFYNEPGLPELYTVIANADPDSFELVGYCAGYEIDSYAYYRDKYRIYVDAEPKPYIDAVSFQYLGVSHKNDNHFGTGKAFAKDKNSVYQGCGEVIEGANPITFSP